MEAKRRIKKFNFQADGSHVALVSEGANQQEVLLMKSVHTVEGQTPLYEISEKEIETNDLRDEVKITTSMQLFLQNFFNLWREDAANLAMILGYSSNNDWFEAEYGEDIKVELLKSQGEVASKKLYDVIQSLEDKYGEKIKKHFEEKAMPTQEEIQKSIDDAIEKALKAQKKEMDDAIALKDAELEKAKSTVEELSKAVETKEKKDLTDVVKGYSFIDEADDFVENIFKLRNLEGFNLILTTLEKAQTAIDAAVTKTVGADGEGETVNVDKSLKTVSEILKARKENK